MEKDILVNLGRVVLINYGPLSGKLAVVVDLVNASKVVVDGPSLGVPRIVITNKRLTLTKFSIPEVTAATSTKDLAAKVAAFKVQDKFNATAFGKKIQKQKRRAALTDFERFKVFQLKKNLGKLVRSHVKKNRAGIKKAIAAGASKDKDAKKEKAAPKQEKKKN